MSIEFLDRVHKELSVTGSAAYEAILAISERVSRKVQIIRLHWHASTLLERMERVTGEVGREMVDHVARRFITKSQPDSNFSALDGILHRAAIRVHDLKQSLLQVDAQIRALKLESIHQDLLRVQQDLTLRSAGIERITISRNASAVGQPVSACPRMGSARIATILRGPFLLPPGNDVVFRPDDIVIVIGLQSEMDELAAWFTAPQTLTVALSSSA